MRLQLLVYEYKTHLAAVCTRPMYLTSAACCHLHHHPTCPFNSMLLPHAGRHAPTRASCLECWLCLVWHRKHRRVRHQKTWLHQPPPSHPPVSQHSIVNMKKAAGAAAAAHCNTPSQCHIHVMPRPWDCGVDLAVVTSRHLCQPALTMTTSLLSPRRPWLL